METPGSFRENFVCNLEIMANLKFITSICNQISKFMIFGPVLFRNVCNYVQMSVIDLKVKLTRSRRSFMNFHA